MSVSLLRKIAAALIVLPLFCGFIASILVAWLFALNPAEHGSLVHEGTYARLREHDSDAIAVRRLIFDGGTIYVTSRTSVRHSAFSVSTSVPLDVAQIIDDFSKSDAMISGREPMCLRKMYGWPFRCLSVQWVLSNASAAFWSDGIEGGLMATPFESLNSHGPGSWHPDLEIIQINSYNALPLRIHPVGLVVNAIVGALPVIVITMAIASVCFTKRRWRVRQGKCQNCKYLVRGCSKCPECGTQSGKLDHMACHISMWPAIIFIILLCCVTAGIGGWRLAITKQPAPIQMAAMQGDMQALRESLSQGASLDDPVHANVSMPFSFIIATPLRPLAWASARGHSHIVEVLVQEGANVSADSGVAIRLAARFGNAHTCRILLSSEATASLDVATRQAIMDAALWSDSLETICVVHEAFPESLTGNTTLHAATTSSGDVLEYALTHGNWSIRDLSEAIRTAEALGDVMAVKILQKHIAAGQ